MSDKNKKDTPKKNGGNILHINCIDIKPKKKYFIAYQQTKRNNFFSKIKIFSPFGLSEKKIGYSNSTKNNNI